MPGGHWARWWASRVQGKSRAQGEQLQRQLQVLVDNVVQYILYQLLEVVLDSLSLMIKEYSEI